MASDIKNKNVIRRPIEEILNSSFGKYAKYIIQDRALPDIRDGLKPVQRRILFAMYNLGITHDKAYKKSARTVGEVIGKYHPHGDSSIYEAMVRMSQEWKNNIPLLDMHGNKGSIDGDSAAAMRYTECRLAKISEYMLENIEKKTVTFIPNFDDSEKEPSFLPSMIPNLLFNGATGIAAGYATNIPPFNPAEVINAIIHRIDNPNCTIASLAKHMPGPDYPTGGIIQGKSGIMEAYETGKGKHVIRAEIEEKEVSKKLKQLIIKSIPYENAISPRTRNLRTQNLRAAAIPVHGRYQRRRAGRQLSRTHRLFRDADGGRIRKRPLLLQFEHKIPVWHHTVILRIHPSWRYDTAL